MHAQEEGACVETVLVAVAEEVDVRELFGGQEGLERDGRVYEHEVGVDPPARALVSYL